MSDEEQGAEISKNAAYLVVRDGHTWRDVYRLIPGQVTTVGRAPTNRVVVRDEICSRNHCEVFLSGDSWTIRDRDSRNGTLVDQHKIEGDFPLAPGQVIGIGNSELGFTYDLSQPFPEFEERDELESDTETTTDFTIDEETGEPAILHRKQQSRYRRPDRTAARDHTSKVLGTLFRLAMDMAGMRDSRKLCELILNSLFEETQIDIGAVLLLPSKKLEDPQPEELRLVAYRSKGDMPYQRVSDYLSRLVIKEREAVLAQDVESDDQLGQRESLGEIQVTSVICCPLRFEDRVLGLIHLYSRDPDNPLEERDLEFTIAVADKAATEIQNLREKESLAKGLARARDANDNLRRQLELNSELIGDSESMQGLRDTIARIAPSPATVLIRGESGVGKELVARAIHFNSDRNEGPFVCMNCAALSESLLESELFGHEKGSFTGAVERKAGKFEQANKGTLFLDEVGEMGPSIQAKFLRALEGHSFERVGGRTPVQVDVRVVAATNRDLESDVEAGEFRKDLYFRLHVVQITVPSLRDHASDIPILANYFLDRFVQKTGRNVRFTQDALDVLARHSWPGNIRELQNTVERTLILALNDVVSADDIQMSALGGSLDSVSGPKSSAAYREISLEDLEQEHILATLDWTKWNKSKASQILGIERSTLDRKLKKYNVSRPEQDDS